MGRLPSSVPSRAASRCGTPYDGRTAPRGGAAQYSAITTSKFKFQVSVATGGLGGGQATREFVKVWRLRDLMCQSPTGGFLLRLLGKVEVWDRETGCACHGPSSSPCLRLPPLVFVSRAKSRRNSLARGLATDPDWRRPRLCAVQLTNAHVVVVAVSALSGIGIVEVVVH